MASVNQTRPHCVNQMGKTHSKPLAARHGRGKAWARHAMCKSAFTLLYLNSQIIFCEEWRSESLLIMQPPIIYCYLPSLRPKNLPQNSNLGHPMPAARDVSWKKVEQHS